MFDQLFIKSERRARIFRYAPLFLWIGLIFFLSSNSGSMTNTSRFIRPFLEWIFPQAPELTIQTYHAFIRKLAHLSVYFVLGLTTFFPFASSKQNWLKNYWFAVSFFVVIAVAALDEFNQSFLASRTSSVFDVGLDTIGGLTALLLCFIYWRRAVKMRRI